MNMPKVIHISSRVFTFVLQYLVASSFGYMSSIDAHKKKRKKRQSKHETRKRAHGNNANKDHESLSAKK
jgi:hypothetical protein